MTFSVLAIFLFVARCCGFTPGNIVVYTVGNGAGTLDSSGHPVFIQEYTPSGIQVSSSALPLFASGSATSEGHLSRSPDGRYLYLTGYRDAGASIASSSAATNPRVVMVLDSTGNPISTTLTDVPNNNPRGATGTNNTDFFFVPAGGSGIRRGSFSETTSTQIVTTGNFRQIKIFDNTLFLGTSGGTNRMLQFSLPVTTPTVTPTAVGGTTFTDSSFGSFVAFDLDGTPGVETFYICHNGALNKYSYDGSSLFPLGSTQQQTELTHVTGRASSPTNVQLFLTNSRSVANGVAVGSAAFTFVDTTGPTGTLSGSLTQLFAPATNASVFRGIELVPEPLPTSLPAGTSPSPSTSAPSSTSPSPSTSTPSTSAPSSTSVPSSTSAPSSTSLSPSTSTPSTSAPSSTSTASPTSAPVVNPNTKAPTTKPSSSGSIVTLSLVGMLAAFLLLF